MKLLASYLLFFSLTIFINGNLYSQSREVDSLLVLLKNASPDTNKVNILFSLTELCEEQDILKYAEPGLKLAEELNYQKGIANILTNIAFVSDNEGNAARALELYQRSVKINEDLKNYASMSNAYRQIGDIYQAKGNSGSALDYYQKGLNAGEKAKDMQSVGRTLCQIGNIYVSFNNYNLALEYYKKALAINLHLNDKNGLSVTYNDIGILYHKQQNTSKALYFYKKSMAIHQEMSNNMGIAGCLNNIAAVYEISDGSIDKAVENYFKCIEILKKIGFKKGLGAVYNNLAILYQKKMDPATAEIYALKAYEVGSESESLRDLNKASETLYHLYYAQKKYKEALEMHKVFKQTTDKISNAEAQRASLQFDFNKKVEIAKNEQARRDMIAAKEKQKQRIISIFVSAVLLMVLIFSLLLFKRYKLTQKQKYIIEQQKKLVDEKQKEVMDSIRYAKRIQTALMTSEKYIAKKLDQLMK
ncbi:MAG: tetratricopeptide repeat protein [Bacteroidia bacterium]|nr:tetratricopeptide repeat protein [Bacteroidia bacterium]